MSPHETSATDRFVTAVAVAAGAGTVLLGVFAYASPGTFADFADFPGHTHFVHDLAAFQLGIGLTVLLATIWPDVLATVLTGFLVANTTHVVNHLVDLDDGGRVWQASGLAVVSLAVAAALGVRLRALDYVVGAVSTASTPALEPYVRQRTILLTSQPRDGDAVSTPVTVAIEGEHAYVCRFDSSLRTERLGGNPRVQIAPLSRRGHQTGPALPARLRRLDDPEARQAARLLRGKYPLFHGALLPLAQQLGPTRGDRAVHFELTPIDEPT